MLKKQHQKSKLPFEIMSSAVCSNPPLCVLCISVISIDKVFIQTYFFSVSVYSLSPGFAVVRDTALCFNSWSHAPSGQDMRASSNFDLVIGAPWNHLCTFQPSRNDEYTFLKDTKQSGTWMLKNGLERCAKLDWNQEIQTKIIECLTFLYPKKTSPRASGACRLRACPAPSPSKRWPYGTWHNHV